MKTASLWVICIYVLLLITLNFVRLNSKYTASPSQCSNVSLECLRKTSSDLLEKEPLETMIFCIRTHKLQHQNADSSLSLFGSAEQNECASEVLSQNLTEILCNSTILHGMEADFPHSICQNEKLFCESQLNSGTQRQNIGCINLQSILSCLYKDQSHPKKKLIHRYLTKFQAVCQHHHHDKVTRQTASVRRCCYSWSEKQSECCLYQTTEELNQPNTPESNADAVNSQMSLGNTATTTLVKKSTGKVRLQCDKSHRMKRSIEANSFENFDPRLAQPKNLQIVPHMFGAFNISWTPPPEAKLSVTHYELVLIHLGQLPSEQELTRCAIYLRNFNITRGNEFLSHRMSSEMQLIINITAPASQTIVTGLPPDKFYRILLFSMSGERRSLPASMPSSPRVPSLPPLSPPTDVRVTSKGTQGTKVSWRPSADAECTGELINYVIFLNSTRLLEPMLLKLDRNARSHVVRDLIPGTHYSVQVAASTRGGVGVPSAPVHFRTEGELPQIELDDTEEGNKSFLPEELDGVDVSYDPFADYDEVSRSHWTTVRMDNHVNPQFFLIPAKIQNLRATPTETTIHLKWSVALRRIKPTVEFEMFGLANREATPKVGQPLQIHLSATADTEEQVGYLPPGTKYIIRWGDIHPGPTEDTVSGDQTEYLIRNLRPGTIYYIRVIAVTPLGDGPAAYTVAMTLAVDAGDPRPLAKDTVIPMNLIVLSVGPTWARVSWELPEHVNTLGGHSLLFQLKYYPINVEHSQRASMQSAALDRVVSIVNVTVPWTEQLVKRPMQFKTMLRALRPATRYEFGVCLVQDSVDKGLKHRSKAALEDPCWSMVQGFETTGQSPADAPQNIRVSFSGIDQSPKSQHSSLSTTSSRYTLEGSKRYSPGARVYWIPPTQPNGNIVSYLVYWTKDRLRPLAEWLEQTIQGTVHQADLRGLDPGDVYFLRLIARNRHGASPFSQVIAFRTPDMNGRGGGMIKLSKEYHDPREINEPLDKIVDDAQFERISGEKSDHSGNEKEHFAEDQLRWIIVGCVLGGTVVILLVATAVLFMRWRKARHSLGIVKRFQIKPQYVTPYPTMTGPSADLIRKHLKFGNSDTCVGNCNASGSPPGTSHGGLLAHTPSDISCDRQLSHDCSKQQLLPTHFGCAEHSVSGRSGSHCTHPSPSITQLTCPCRGTTDGVSQFWCPPPGFAVPCMEDGQSIPAGSENDPTGSYTGGSSQMEVFGRKTSKRVCDNASECFNRGPDCPTSVGCANCADWSQSTNDNSARTMTMSFLATNVHPVSRTHSDRCDVSCCKANYFLPSPTNRYQMGTYLDELGDRSPDCGVIQRHHTSNMTGGFTGSGSLIEDEATASSPASSSAGLFHLSTPPSQGSAHMKSSHFSASHQMNHYLSMKQDGSQLPGVFGQSRPHIRFCDGKKNRKTSATLCHSDRGPFGVNVQGGPNVMSSDYASQQSSLSNQSSASSATGQGCSPELHQSETRAAQVGLSFALDRVPTPEPTPRPAPFSRLAAGILQQQQSILQNMPSIDQSAMSPSILKKAKFLTNNCNSDIKKVGDDFDPKSTSDSTYIVSEKEIAREYSAEELSQEMANLEGLMKDLNKITQCQFEC